MAYSKTPFLIRCVVVEDRRNRPGALTDYSQVDTLGVRYKSVNFGSGKSPSSPDGWSQIDRDRARCLSWAVLTITGHSAQVVTGVPHVQENNPP